MYREYDANGEKHDTAFLLVAVSQIFYIIMEFFYDEVSVMFKTIFTVALHSSVVYIS